MRLTTNQYDTVGLYGDLAQLAWPQARIRTMPLAGMRIVGDQTGDCSNCIESIAVPVAASDTMKCMGARSADAAAKILNSCPGEPVRW